MARPTRPASRRGRRDAEGARRGARPPDVGCRGLACCQQGLGGAPGARAAPGDGTDDGLSMDARCGKAERRCVRMLGMRCAPCCCLGYARAAAAERPVNQPPKACTAAGLQPLKSASRAIRCKGAALTPHSIARALLLRPATGPSAVARSNPAWRVHVSTARTCHSKADILYACLW